MGPSDNVAIVALIVSLIALVLSSGQALQQFLGTAEGYRRCARAVIGPWHRLRWRHFVWSEFRYETHFITPEFMLLSEAQLYDNEGQPHVLTRVPNDLPIKSRFWKLLKRRSRDDVIDNAEAVLSKSLHMSEEHGDHRGTDASRQRLGSNIKKFLQSVQDEEKAVIVPGPSSLDVVRQLAPFTGVSPSQLTGGRPLLQSQNRASWLVLLQRMYGTYDSYIAAFTANTEYVQCPIPHAPSRYYKPDDLALRNDEVTNVCVVFREWVWDIMPNEVTKPLAKTTLGDLVIFAVRLGMQWRSLDLVRNQLLADGNGYSFTFTETPGLGLIGKLNSPGRQHSPPELIPNQATDKLICGIIPGSQFLVDQDIPCVTDDREVSTMAAISARLSERNTLFDVWTGRNEHCETQNEAIALLCEFLPFSGSRCTTHHFSGWASNRQSCFRWYEARFRFWRRLKELKIEGKLNDDTLDLVLKHLTYLRDTYQSDFFGLIASLAARAEDGQSENDRRQKQVNIISDCRSIFNWTTKWLLEHGFWERDNESDSWNVRTWYMHMVSAHCHMSCNTIHLGNKRTKQNKTNPKFPKWNKQAKETYFELTDAGTGIPPAVETYIFSAHRYNIAEVYIENLEHKEHGILRYMRDQGCEIDEQMVIKAWWVMMLRGIAWSLPTVEPSSEVRAIPATYYDNDTPVWIT